MEPRDTDARARNDGNKFDFRHNVRRIWRKCVALLKTNLLLCLTMIGVLLGFAIGFTVREYSPTETQLIWIGLPGQLYLRLFKMLIVPLIVCTVISGASSLDPKSNGKMSLIAFICAIASNITGSAIGIGFSLLFQPGGDTTRQGTDYTREGLQSTDIFIDLILNIVPDNLLEAAFAQTQTQYRAIENTLLANITEIGSNKTERFYGKVDSPNISGLIFTCTLFGIACTKLGEKGEPFLAFIRSLSDIVITVLTWCVWVTPIGVISQIAATVATIKDVTIVFQQMGLFVATVAASSATYQLVVMPAVLSVTTKRNPYLFLMSIAQSWMITFATTTTAISIPEMLHACEVNNKIDKRVAGFAVPFSVSISCAGGALYIASSTRFVANLSDSPMSAKDYILLWLLASMAAMAIPSSPSASLITAIMVMTSINIEIDDIALLLALEWLIDRLRVTCSPVTHTFCAAIVYQFCIDDLMAIDDQQGRSTKNISTTTTTLTTAPCDTETGE